MADDRELYCLVDRSRWGSFGGILISGMLWDGFPKLKGIRKPKCYEIIRTGPFVPPFSFPSRSCVVTAAVKSELECSGLRGIRFEEARIAKVVKSNWEQWDLSADLDYSKLPDDDRIEQPEDLIFVPSHCPDLATQMPQLWFLFGMKTELVWTSNSDEGGRVSWSLSNLDGADVFTVGERTIEVNRRAKEWFEERYSDWVSFDVEPIAP